MRKKIVISLLLVFCIFASNGGVLINANADKSFLAKKKTDSYTIVVDTSNQQVRTYKTVSGVQYLVKKFICSTGAPATPTPHGTFYMGSFRNSFGYFTKFDCWAQYMMQISGDILFHSVLYSKRDTNTLIYSSLYNLGKAVSHGCVRLRPEDAKWIWNHSAAGTKIIVGNYVASAAKESIKSCPVSVSLNRKKVSVKYGKKITLKVKLKRKPGAGTLVKNVFWKSDKKSIAVVDSKGVITPKGIGKTVITASAVGGKKATCTVTVLYADVTAIKVSPLQLKLTVGQSQKLKVNLKPGKTNPKLIYTSLDKEVAVVDGKGKVTAVSAGETVIEVRAANGKKASCKVVVDPLPDPDPEPTTPIMPLATPVI